MKEIRFKAWDVDKKEMFDIVKIDFRSDLPIGCGFFGNPLLGVAWRPRERVIPLQYTGLKDKNGKEIYEGDILKYYLFDGSYVLKQIIWVTDEYSTGFFLTPSVPYNYSDIGKEKEKNLEVAGNIYENSELLKEK